MNLSLIVWKSYWGTSEKLFLQFPSVSIFHSSTPITSKTVCCFLPAATGRAEQSPSVQSGWCRPGSADWSLGYAAPDTVASGPPDSHRENDHIKILLVYKFLHGLAPPFLSVLLHPYTHILSTPHSRLCTMGDTDFSVAGPNLWSALPQIWHQCKYFKSILKSYMYRLTFPAAL